jgi:diacylglycerol kinase (ATP)
MRVTLIHNPKAGANEQSSVDEFLALIRAAGHAVTCQLPNDEDWEKALEDPGDLVAVAGGDGTVGAVAIHLAGRHVPIAILPVGTANNISRVLGLADMPPERLIARWPKARRVAFDAGIVHGPWGTTRFIEGLGVGLLARAITELDAKAEVSFGRKEDREGKITSGLRRLRDLLGNCPAKAMQIRLDGQDLSGEYILLEVMNIQHIGPGLHFAPDADPGDGLLDVVLFTAEHRDTLDTYLASRLEGNLQPLQWPARRGKHLELQCEDSDMHIDDKVFSAHGLTSSELPMHLDVKVNNNVLEFLA